MSLDQEIKGQLQQYLALLENNVVFTASFDTSEHSKEVQAFLEEIVSMSDKLSLQTEKLHYTPSFQIDTKNGSSGIVFAGVPLGHEFTSFVLALLQVGGRAPKIDEATAKRIKNIEQEFHFETFVSLTCHNCPDVVQALNIMSVLNPSISHTMIEGGMFKDIVEEKEVMAVPTVFLDGKEFASGRMSIEQILDKLPIEAEVEDDLSTRDPYDVLVVGAGPAGVSAAIYAARKGIRTGIIAERFGGQVLETVGIENLIGTPYTEGEKLAQALEIHAKEYPIDIIKARKVASLSVEGDMHVVTLDNGATLKAKALIIATGARWRNVNVPGESEFKNKGVAYCPHCDGPLFAGKDVAVIGGGNSGIEAAIDLAGLTKHVTVIEFLPELKADEVLQKRLATLTNVTVIKNAQTMKILGDKKVTSLTYKDRATEEIHGVDLAGVFVQIGLVPNTEFLDERFAKTKMGEIEVDKRGQTSVPGIFAAGDCTDSAYKQIIISMGSGATAALGAFDYLIRH
ncbi:alkyl hydroperoxide reductase subunit F [Enterococcus italicus]|uniref:Alkyl hydroperoxide reductase, F subunit n=1 Tax=Enterococcus italicus (strain DSM 15952 / CCUG 50447 / LMG 22039 / TP 1.5) TaxID=888064 RepID=E6LI05_ENTI1|nr:alkyl hydroperoxide reductase subunit F [Enterococcus italicus]EFU73171.1 alkyl hydroperoxide reductase, F subunit [Enterococcus italicus DSM 15952]OJG60181.1 NADH dehydrogenase [Enterococcus italicus DSM 15952]HCS30982.1 alkyl hydroperoxide reductase subunit F [Enterococcus sp.]